MKRTAEEDAEEATPKATPAKKRKTAVASRKGKKEVSKAPKISTSNAAVRDFSKPSLVLIKDKFILGMLSNMFFSCRSNNGCSQHTGQRWSVQIGQIKFSGVRNFAYEALVFARDPAPDDTASKPLTFNIPTSTLKPLLDALTCIFEKSSPPPAQQ